MADLTVAHILAEQPSLVERAKAQHEYEQQLRTDKQLKERADLMSDTYNFLLDVLGMTASELEALYFKFERFNDAREMLVWQIDGVDFRSRYIVKVTVKGDEFDLIVEVNPRGQTVFKAFATLGTLGKLLS